MRLLSISLTCGLLMIGAALLRAAPTTNPTTAPSTQPAAPVNKFCAVNKDEKVDGKTTYVYNGKAIGFCCPDCIDDFKKDPEKYAKDLK